MNGQNLKNSEMQLIEFDGDSKDLILKMMKNEYLQTGKFVKDQLTVSPKIMSSIISASGLGLTSLSSTFSSTLFMATANVDTLAKIGLGVGSTVIGEEGKFVAQAAFLPIASSLPVVAPLMAMQTLTAVAILQQLGEVNKKLDVIKDTVDTVMLRQEATVVGELLSAINIIDEIYGQYGACGIFSNDMLIRLALTERDAARLLARYKILENFKEESATIGITKSDTYLTMTASFLNLRIKYLRTCVDIQENPQYVSQSANAFKTVLRDSVDLWNGLLSKPKAVLAEIAKLEKKPEANKIAQLLRNTGKDITKLNAEYTATLEVINHVQSDFYQIIESIQSIVKTNTDCNNLPTLICWHDEEGVKCVATNESLQI